MRRIIAVAILALTALGISCSRQKALDTIMADPQMKTYIMGEMLKNEATKAVLADSIFADKAIVDKYLDGLTTNEISRSDLLNRMLKADPSGAWIVNRLAEDPGIKAAMKAASK